jgi:hypothetical protein
MATKKSQEKAKKTPSKAAQMVAEEIKKRQEAQADAEKDIQLEDLQLEKEIVEVDMTNADKPQDKPEDVKPQDADKPATTVLTTKEVAAMCGTTPKALRRVLRAKWYNDGQMTHYSWTKDDAILKEILAYYKEKEKAAAAAK